MKGQLLHSGRPWRRGAQLVAAAAAIAGTGAVGGCLNRPIEPVEPRTTSTVVEKLTQSQVDKIDLLLMIDNSRSMADKQQILIKAVPDLVKGLVNPKCVDTDSGNPVPIADQPATPTDPCPAGSKREFEPVLDIHIGIISSSIGGHGSDACPNSETVTCPGGATNTSNNDMGHLVTRKDPCVGGDVATYELKGFLAWDPKAKLDPPGEANIGDLMGAAGLVPTMSELVSGTGQIGCGYESQLESWYRFLVDPTPYDHIELDDKGRATPVGTDNVLLQQRSDFMRSSSLLAIIMLTDENDCSIKEYGQFYFAAQQREPTNPGQNFYLPKARSECASNPNDACCKSCGQDPGDCPPDPGCGTHNKDSDDVNLRCWDQKKRFGIDFLYAIDRYTTALTSPVVPDRTGAMVDNPLFSDLNPSDADSAIRDPGLVFFAGIVGVPWQDIARVNANGQPDLLMGLNQEKEPVGGFKNAKELALTDQDGHTTWDYIIGDPDNFIPALDPHMIESTDPRTGTNPITGTNLAPPNSASGTDPINGHEWTVGVKNGLPIPKDDLQYACIFDLISPKDCSPAANNVSCDCNDATNDNPLCEPDPNHGGDRTLQVRAKGYPGIRELQALKSVGTQGIVASVCPAQIINEDSSDFGYRPAIGAIIDRLKTALGGKCLPRPLKPNKDGQVQCLILEGRNTQGAAEGGKCDAFCNSLEARQAVTDDHKAAVEDPNVQDLAKKANLDCFCEIKQLSGTTNSTCSVTSPLSACQCDLDNPPVFEGSQVDGWCYVDATTNPPTGKVELVAKCPDTERRQIRFVGLGNPAPGATLFITCAGD